MPGPAGISSVPEAPPWLSPWCSDYFKEDGLFWDDDLPELVFSTSEGIEKLAEYICEEVLLEARLQEASKQYRIAEGLLQVYGTLGEVRDEARKRKETIKEIERDLTRVRGELKNIDEIIFCVNDDNDSTATRPAQYKTPSPPTWSLVTYAKLLSGVRKEGLAKDVLESIVVEPV